MDEGSKRKEGEGEKENETKIGEEEKKKHTTLRVESKREEKAEEERHERRRGRGEEPVWTSTGRLSVPYTPLLTSLPPSLPRPPPHLPSDSDWLNFFFWRAVMRLLSPGTTWIYVPQKCKRIQSRARAGTLMELEGQGQSQLKVELLFMIVYVTFTASSLFFILWTFNCHFNALNFNFL